MKCEFDKAAIFLEHEGADPPISCANKPKYQMKVTGRDLGEKRRLTFKLCTPCHNILSKMLDDKEDQNNDDGNAFFVTFRFRRIVGA